MLVRPTCPASRAQLPHQIDRGFASGHDVPVVNVWSALWRVCDCPGLQHPDSGAAAVFLPAVFDVLGAVFEIWAVSFFPAAGNGGFFFLFSLFPEFFGSWAQFRVGESVGKDCFDRECVLDAFWGRCVLPSMEKRAKGSVDVVNVEGVTARIGECLLRFT